MPNVPEPMEHGVESERERQNGLKKEEEGRKMLQESIEHVLRPQTQERVGDVTYMRARNKKEGRD
jgi:hypothetical protein